MELLSGGDAIVRSLEDEGIKFIYGYPGGASLHIYDALHRSGKIFHFLVRHEQAAVHMADAYARATGKTGVVLVTSGPGATNTITGIATAYMDSIPMVVISGQVPSILIGQDAFQETDMLGISRPVAKHNLLVEKMQDIPMLIRKAFYIASSGRPGPVVIDIPKDMADPDKKFAYEYQKNISIPTYNTSFTIDEKKIKQVVSLLLQAKKPVLYYGGGVILSQASSSLIKLAQLLDIPVTSTLMGLGAYPATGKKFLGMLGMHGTYTANAAMHNSDLVLALGARFDDRVTNNVNEFCPEAKIIHIDIDPASIAKIIPVTIGIVSDIIKVLPLIIQQIEASDYQPKLQSWWTQIRKWQQQNPLSYAKSKDKIKPQYVIETLYEVTSGRAYITTDVGQHQMFAAQYYKFDQPNKWITSGGLGTMGFGLPAAMGVQLAFPDAQVACVTGDGSIQMNIQELSTCKQYGIPIKIINLNNRYLGMVRQWQDMYYASRHSHSYMDSLPDFIKLAQAYGHIGIRVDKTAHLKDAMLEAFSYTDKLVFLDIDVDPTEHVYPMHIKGGSMQDMLLTKQEDN